MFDQLYEAQQSIVQETEKRIAAHKKVLEEERKAKAPQLKQALKLCGIDCEPESETIRIDGIRFRLWQGDEYEGTTWEYTHRGEYRNYNAQELKEFDKKFHDDEYAYSFTILVDHVIPDDIQERDDDWWDYKWETEAVHVHSVFTFADWTGIKAQLADAIDSVKANFESAMQREEQPTAEAMAPLLQIRVENYLTDHKASAEEITRMLLDGWEIAYEGATRDADGDPCLLIRWVKDNR